jgi:signal transduction histidine kinase
VATVGCILILNVVINTRLEKQAMLLRETRLQNELLGKTNEMNRDFLRMVSHELKTPLTVISGYAQLMERQMEKGISSDAAPERLETIRQEADRLSEIVTRLMDYTFGNSRDAELAAVDVSTLFESASAVLRPVCAKRGNTLTFSENAGVRVRGSFELLLQVLINLVINANRHTENGVIAVEAEDLGGAVAFRVRDNGEGIAPEIAPHIFEKGFTTTNGQGLGLAICSETVALHGGTMELESTGADGSCFRFTIPKEAGK